MLLLLVLLCWGHGRAMKAEQRARGGEELFLHSDAVGFLRHIELNPNWSCVFPSPLL